MNKVSILISSLLLYLMSCSGHTDISPENNDETNVIVKEILKNYPELVGNWWQSKIITNNSVFDCGDHGIPCNDYTLQIDSQKTLSFSNIPNFRVYQDSVTMEGKILMMLCNENFLFTINNIANDTIFYSDNKLHYNFPIIDLNDSSVEIAINKYSKVIYRIYHH